MHIYYTILLYTILYYTVLYYNSHLASSCRLPRPAPRAFSCATGAPVRSAQVGAYDDRA